MDDFQRNLRDRRYQLLIVFLVVCGFVQLIWLSGSGRYALTAVTGVTGLIALEKSILERSRTFLFLCALVILITAIISFYFFELYEPRGRASGPLFFFLGLVAHFAISLIDRRTGEQ